MNGIHPGLALALRRVACVARKEFRQLLRDPLTSGFVVGMPLVQILLFGYAINEDVRHLRTVLVDERPSQMTRRLAGELEATQTFRLTASASSTAAASELLRRGEVQAAVILPADFSRRIYRGHGASFAVLVDATDPIAAHAVRAAAEGLAADLERRLAGVAQPRAIGEDAPPSLRPLRVSVQQQYNPEMRSALFSVPALLGVILTTTMIMMTALSVVRERERGTFEFLIGTPIGRVELMFGKITPYIAIGAVQIVLTLGSGALLFDVPFRGSVSNLAVSSLVFIAANLALGLVISSVTHNQLQATQLSFFIFLPSVLLSGFMFPFEAMPAPARWLGELLPLTHYVRICRGIVLRGAPLSSLAGDLLALLLFLAVTLAASARLFKKQLL